MLLQLFRYFKIILYNTKHIYSYLGYNREHIFITFLLCESKQHQQDGDGDVVGIFGLKVQLHF